MNLKIFPSLWQRSVINEAGLRAQPWWNIEDTGVESEIRKLEKEVDMIRRYSVCTYMYMYMYTYVTCTCAFYILYVYPVCVYMYYLYVHVHV